MYAFRTHRSPPDEGERRRIQACDGQDGARSWGRQDASAGVEGCDLLLGTR